MQELWIQVRAEIKWAEGENEEKTKNMCLLLLIVCATEKSAKVCVTARSSSCPD